MMLGNRVLVFSLAFIIASVTELISALLNGDDDDLFTFALTVGVVYWMLLDKGGAE